MSILDTLKTQAEKIMGDRSAAEEYTGEVLARLPEVAAIVEQFESAFADGFQAADLAVIGKVIPAMVKIAEQYEAWDVEQRETFVVDLVWLAYIVIDKGMDGTLNRINIPVLFGALEQKFERLMVAFVVKAVMHAMEAKAAQ